MNGNHKIAIAVIAIVVAVLLAFVMGTLWFLLHQQPVVPVTNIWYNNTTVIQYQCCEIRENCSVTPEPDVVIYYPTPMYSTESSYYSIDEPTPTQTPLATPEFPFLHG